MEQILESVAAGLILALIGIPAFIAYQNPTAYRQRAFPFLIVLWFFLTAMALTWAVAIATSGTAGFDAAGSLSRKGPEVRKAIEAYQLPLWTIGLAPYIAITYFVMLLALPFLGLTAHSQQGGGWPFGTILAPRKRLDSGAGRHESKRQRSHLNPARAPGRQEVQSLVSQAVRDLPDSGARSSSATRGHKN